MEEDKEGVTGEEVNEKKKRGELEVHDPGKKK